MNAKHNLCYKMTKIFLYFISLFSYLIVLLCSDPKGILSKEFNGLSKFFLNVYIIIAYFLIMIHSISPKIICEVFVNNISFIFTDKGKILINLYIGFLYMKSKDIYQFILGIILIIISVLLLLFHMIFSYYFSVKDVEKSEKTVKISTENHDNSVKDSVVDCKLDVDKALESSVSEEKG